MDSAHQQSNRGYCPIILLYSLFLLVFFCFTQRHFLNSCLNLLLEGPEINYFRLRRITSCASVTTTVAFTQPTSKTTFMCYVCPYFANTDRTMTLSCLTVRPSPLTSSFVQIGFDALAVFEEVTPSFGRCWFCSIPKRSVFCNCCCFHREVKRSGDGSKEMFLLSGLQGCVPSTCPCESSKRHSCRNVAFSRNIRR
jgi:hypothetical protein